jgi:hypothetical protein
MQTVQLMREGLRGKAYLQDPAILDEREYSDDQSSHGTV